MRLHRAPTVVLALVLVGPVSLAAQEPPSRVSLEEAVELLHENSPEMALARSRVRAAEGEARQADAFPNPSIRGTHESLGSGGADVSESYLNVSQRIEWPRRRGARGRAADRRLDAERSWFRGDSARLVFEVRRAYLDAAAAAERLRVLEEVSAVFRRSAERAEERFSAGDVSRFARDRIRLERARYERSLASARVELEAARRALGALILPEAGGAPATEGLPTRLPPEAADAYADATAGHPSVVAARARADAARADADLARSRRIPDPTLTGGYKTQSDGLDGVFLGVSLPLPLLDRGGGAVAAAEARLDAERSRVDLTRRSVERELQRAVARYRAVRAQAGVVEASVEGGGTGLLETARVAYREGEMELLELLDAAAARRDAGILDAELRADVWTSYYELIRASAGAVGGSGSDEGSR